MSPELRARARIQRFGREARFLWLGWWRWISFPVKHPRLWWYCRRFDLAMMLGHDAPEPPRWMKVARVRV